MGQVEPGLHDIKVWRTGTYATRLQLFASIEPLVKYVLTGWTVELEIDNCYTLTVGNGLTVENENEIVAKLTKAQTEMPPAASKADYRLRLKKGSGAAEEVIYPMKGIVTFKNP